MKSLLLNGSPKSVLGTKDIANLLSISKESANVTAARYTQKGLLIRLKRDFYIPVNIFEKFNEKDFFQAANIIQVPSYISLISALSYYNISTQQFQNVYESIAVKRTKNVKVRNIEFNFYLVKKKFYTGFALEDNFFIAEPEKAFADIVYLTSLAKYSCDFTAINFKRLNKKKVDNYIKLTNQRTKLFWGKLCKTYKI
jgi:predicted transcriptional regulator of viral defense system